MLKTKWQLTTGLYSQPDRNLQRVPQIGYQGPASIDCDILAVWELSLTYFEYALNKTIF